ncbi:glycosyltransferase [Legionella impletisoli]|uniref:Glycosyl transferase n=1 Tax=Legionella impletisoli TaxID=343510 RepID=A0A917JMB6_9GAMM|nr:glycosyltransferase [Legionella impletisoli]GGI77242.1 glycosyl transferase [Legionella impletisoli]
MTKRPIIFPLQRLIACLRNLHATGVDRVEIRYAYWLIQQKKLGRKVIFVRQEQNVMQKIPDNKAEKIIIGLWQRWIENKGVTFNHYAQNADRNIFLLINKIRNLFGPSLDRNIVADLKNQPDPVYLNISYKGVEFPEIHKLLRDKIRATLYFYIHDIVAIEYPEFFYGKASIFQKRVKVIAQYGEAIFVNSIDTASRFNAYCKKEKLPILPNILAKIGVEDKFIQTANLPLCPLPKQLAVLTQGHPFFVAIGTVEPRKNYLLLLNIWRELAVEYEAKGRVCPKLLMIGKRGWENENIRDLLERSPSIIRYVKELNDVSDEVMLSLIRHSNGLLMPSFAEGWGIPVAEALTLNIPVLCSDIPAHRESGQNQAHYIHPLDGLGWKKAIMKYADTKQKLGGSYKPDTWSSHFNHIERFL